MVLLLFASRTNAQPPVQHAVYVEGQPWNEIISLPMFAAVPQHYSAREVIVSRKTISEENHALRYVFDSAGFLVYRGNDPQRHIGNHYGYEDGRLTMQYHVSDPSRRTVQEWQHRLCHPPPEPGPRFTYDERGRLIEWFGGPGVNSRYRYDSLGRLMEEENERIRHTRTLYHYSPRKITATCYELNDYTSAERLAEIETYYFDTEGNLLEWTRLTRPQPTRDGVDNAPLRQPPDQISRASYVYGKKKRLLRMEYKTEVPYSQPSFTRHFTYDRKGRLRNAISYQEGKAVLEESFRYLP